MDRPLIRTNYPSEPAYRAAWAAIREQLSLTRTSLQRQLAEQQHYHNLLAADTQVVEDMIRQAMAQLDLEAAAKGSFREVYVESFKSPVVGLDVDQTGGYATLPVVSRERIPLGEPEIVWDRSSADGIPGSFVETDRTTRDSTGVAVPRIVAGHEKPVALVDGSAASQFEWERCVANVEQSAPQYNAGTGSFDGYTTGNLLDIIAPDTWEVSIAGRGSLRMVALPGEFAVPLRLTLRFPLTEGTQRASHLELVPFQRSNRVPAPLVTRVTAAGGRQLLGTRFRLSRARSLRLPATDLASLELELTQSDSYSTTLAHRYFEEKLEHHDQHSGYLFGLIGGHNRVAYEWRRVSDPGLSLGTINTKAGTSATEVAGSVINGLAGAAGGVMNLIPGMGWLGDMVSSAGQLFKDVADGLFGTTKKWTDRTNVRENWDLFTGLRYALGLAEVALNKVTFASSGQTVLGPFLFKQPSNHLSVALTKQIPESFGEGSWIQLEVSPDGENWVAIEEQKVQRFEHERAFVRVTLRRPEELIFDSVLLHEVQVYVS